MSPSSELGNKNLLTEHITQENVLHTQVRLNLRHTRAHTLRVCFFFFILYFLFFTKKNLFQFLNRVPLLLSSMCLLRLIFIYCVCVCMYSHGLSIAIVFFSLFLLDEKTPAVGFFSLSLIFLFFQIFRTTTTVFFFYLWLVIVFILVALLHTLVSPSRKENKLQ